MSLSKSFNIEQEESSFPQTPILVPHNRPPEESHCPICGSNDCSSVTTLPFAVKAGDIQSLIARCGSCGCYWRQFHPGARFDQHWELQSYTKPHYEDKLRRARQPFFASLAKWALSHAKTLPPKPSVLDVGCAYGHLLEVFRDLGFRGTGIEPVDWLRARLNREGEFKAYRTVDDLPPGARYDVIAVIDSLYYFDEPLRGLQELARHMTDQGMMIVRVTNRTPLLDMFRRHFRRGITSGIFGDQLFAFSDKGMSIAFRKSALKVRSFCFFEQKPIAGRRLKNFVYYRLVPAIAAVTRLKITPGLTYLCTRDGALSAADSTSVKATPLEEAGNAY